MKYLDIYFEPDYAKLYLEGDDELVEYVFQNEIGEISNLFIKRKIDMIVNGEQYYDIITPYGYGGPIIRRLVDDKKKDELIREYMLDFELFNIENKIVSEFIRFHPIIGNGVDFKEAYNSQFDRKTVGTTLTYEDVIGVEFSKHKRKDIRRILKNPNIQYEINENPTNLEDFIEIYYSTMDRDKATEYYYFDKAYFQKMIEFFPENIITAKVFYGEKIISMGIYFRYGKYLHAHLSGTLSEYLEYSPAYILKYALAIYGHEKGYEVIHYGGGTSRDLDNGVYRFKKEFGKNTVFDFYIGKKIWNKVIYNKLCELKGKNPQSEFFPAYRG